VRMFEEKNTVTIGKLWGVPFKLDIAIMIFWFLGWAILDVEIKKELSLSWIVIRAAVSLVSTALHEIGHAYVALKNGLKLSL